MSGGGELREGGAYLSCASQRSPIGHRGGGASPAHVADRGAPTGRRRGGGMREEGEGGEQTGVCIPTPYTPICMQTRMETGVGADSRRREGCVY